MMVREELAKLFRPDDVAPRLSSRARFWKWTCASAALLAAAAIFLTVEASFWRSLLLAFFLACPLIVLWGALKGVRPLPVPLGPVPATRGMTLNWMAPWYDWMWASLFGFGRRFRNRVFELAAPKPGEHALDVGCGTGWFTRRAAAAVGPTGIACGIDPAPDMIRIAMQTETPHGARFELGVLEDLPYGDGRFDLVVSSMVIHHLPPDLKRRGLREIVRVLKPGGRVLLAEPCRPQSALWRAVLWPFGLHPNLADHLAGRTGEMLAAAGFIDTATQGRCGPWIEFWTARKP